MKSIVISGQPGAGSTTLAKYVAKKLNWKHFSMGQVFKDIADGNAQNRYYFPLLDRMLKQSSIELPETHSESTTRSLLNLWNTQFGRSRKFHEALDNLQRELAQNESIILDGKLTIHMIPTALLKIWVYAPFDVRAQRLAKRHNISEEESVLLLSEREKRERHEWKSIYGFDYFEQHKEADISIDTSNINEEQAANIILSRLESSKS